MKDAACPISTRGGGGRLVELPRAQRHGVEREAAERREHRLRWLALPARETGQTAGRSNHELVKPQGGRGPAARLERDSVDRTEERELFERARRAEDLRPKRAVCKAARPLRGK
jgi:hypothetical protein